MNDFELEKRLKAAPAPPLEAEYVQDFPRIVFARIRSTSLPIRAERRRSPCLAWGAGIVFACLIIGFAVNHWRGRVEAGAPGELLANAKLIRETLAMFPNQLRAIVQDEHGMQLVLSVKPDVPDSRPLYVRICAGKHCSSLVTFSGQEIQIAEQKLTVLSDARGGIIVIGNNFVWSSLNATHATSNLRITARNLGAVAI
jgi:hypothetical protein